MASTRRDKRLAFEVNKFDPVKTFSIFPQLALSNALRYFEPSLHAELAKEFAEELRTYGHIYMYRFLPDVELR